jgi:hypothetical protein
MLQHVLLSTSNPTAHARRVRLTRVTTSQSLAKGNRSPRELAFLAANWLAGSLTIREPTVSLASLMFSVCPALIRDELRKLEATTVAPSPIETIWAGMSAAERDHFVRDHLLEVWDVVDRITH